MTPLAAHSSRHENDESRGVETGSALLSAVSIVGDEVCNLKEERLGSIQDLMLDVHNGEIRYAVLSPGGFPGAGDRLFAIPWKALSRDSEYKRFTLDIEVDRLRKASGFDKDEWPNMTGSLRDLSALYDTP